MTKKDSVSAIVLTKNSEELIEDCMKSISWAEEIIVVDSNSEDKTLDFVKKFKTKIVEMENGGFSEKRNKGAKEAGGKWLLYVDADERVTPRLKKEIESVISQQSSATNNIVAFAIPRRNIILGKEMRRGGWWPDYVKRLFLKSQFKGWEGELHEEPNFEGELGHLKNPLIHLKHDNLSDMVDKTNEWSEIEARLMYKAGHPKMNVLRFLSAVFREFWLRMIRHMAFLDGTEGIIYALYQVYSRFISYAKLWEMQLKAQN